MDGPEALEFIKKLFIKIDCDKSGMIDSKETVDWIRELEQKFIRKDTKENMDQFDKNKDNFLAFRGMTHNNLDESFMTHSEFLDLVGLRENEKETKDYKDEVHKFGICDQNKGTHPYINRTDPTLKMDI